MFGLFKLAASIAIDTRNATQIEVNKCIGGDKRPTLRNSLVSGDPDLARGSEVFYYSSAGFLTVWRGQPSSQ
jgi:hypothetical protein